MIMVFPREFFQEQKKTVLNYFIALRIKIETDIF